MNDARTPLLLLLLAGLLAVIAFSSGTEVAMLSVNRYRIRHRAQSGSHTARVLERLLQRPDDWLGVNLVILAAAGVFASQAVTILAQRTGWHHALPVAGAVLSVIVIVFGELAPKIFGATYPEAAALGSAHLYAALVVVARPVLWLTSRAAHAVLWLAGVRRGGQGHSLSTDELRTVVAEAGPMLPARHRQMLLSVLDLGQVTVDDIMVPRQEIAGIDLNDGWEDILEQLRQTAHSRLPVYEGELDNLVGVLHMRRVAQELARDDVLTRERLAAIAREREPHFVPEGAALSVQLADFQRARRRMAFVVNEYGDVVGLVTLEDILEEIVGEFTTDPATVAHRDVHVEKPGVFIVNASATIRALNRALSWQLPTGGPKTVNGLLLERLETIPEPGTALKIGDYQFEVLQTADNAIRTVRARRSQPAAG